MTLVRQFLIIFGVCISLVSKSDTCESLLGGNIGPNSLLGEFYTFQAQLLRKGSMMTQTDRTLVRELTDLLKEFGSNVILANDQDLIFIIKDNQSFDYLQKYSSAVLTKNLIAKPRLTHKSKNIAQSKVLNQLTQLVQSQRISHEWNLSLNDFFSNSSRPLVLPMASNLKLLQVAEKASYEPDNGLQTLYQAGLLLDKYQALSTLRQNFALQRETLLENIKQAKIKVAIEPPTYGFLDPSIRYRMESQDELVFTLEEAKREYEENPSSLTSLNSSWNATIGEVYFDVILESPADAERLIEYMSFDPSIEIRTEKSSNWDAH